MQQISNFLGIAPKPAAEPATTTTELEVREEEIHPALKIALQQWEILVAASKEHVIEPAVKKSVELKEKAAVALEPHIEKLKLQLQPHIDAFLKFIEPYVEQAKLLAAQSKEKAIEYYTIAEPTLISLKEAAEPYAQAAAEKCCVITQEAKVELDKHAVLIKQKTVQVIDAKKRESQQWMSSQQEAAAKAMGLQVKLSQQVWEGAVAGAQHAAKSANELKSVREMEAKTTDLKSKFLKAENYTAAGIALDAQTKLKDLGDRAEASILAKVDAINREDYAAAAVHRKALDDIAVEAETALASVPPLSAGKGDESGLATSVASSAVSNALATNAAKMAEVD